MAASTEPLPISPSLLRSPRKRRGVLRLLRLTEVILPHFGRFAIAIGALLLGGLIGLVYPQAVRYAIDEGVNAASFATLDTIVAGLFVLFVLHAGLTWLRHYLMSWLGQRAVAELRRRVFGRILALEPAWFHSRSSGELVGRLAADVTIVE